MKKLIIVTTVPLTLNEFLKEQVVFLSNHFYVILISSGELECQEELKNYGVRYINIKMIRAINPFLDILSIYNLVKVFYDIKPDIVHSYTPKAGLVSMISAYITRVPSRLHTFTGLLFPTLSGAKKKLFMLVDRLICACSTKPIPEGKGVKRDLLKAGVTSKDLQVIGNGNIAGIDTKFFSQYQFLKDVEKGKSKISYTKINSDEFVFSFIGRFTNDKGMRELIDAFSDMPSNCRLLLAGQQDERAPLSKEYVQKIKDNPNIIDYGWIIDIRGILFSSDVFILPSYREGFPNTPLQASAMKVPSIVTDINGSNEIISDGINGFVIPPQCTKSLRQAMLNALDGSAELSKLGEAAREIVCSRYERKVHHHNMLTLYKECCK